MVTLLPTILHLVYDWTRLASSIKAIIYHKLIPPLYIAFTAPS